MDDLTIIELYFDRSEQAIDETDKKYGKLCRSLAGSILSSDEDAEKCVSDAYLSVWNTIPPTRPNNFTAFLCRIVRNLSLKRLDYNTAQKRNGNVTVPLSELEEVLHTAPEPELEELGKLLSRFLRQEKADAAMFLSGGTISLTPSPTLPSAIRFPKARSKSCCTTPETA